MDINAGPEAQEMYEIGPLTYGQGYVSVWMESYGCREAAFMNDRAIVAAYVGAPNQDSKQLFRAWVDAHELPAVLDHWANVLR